MTETNALKVGDRVIYTFNEQAPPFGIPPETIATITSVDPRNGVLDLEFPEEVVATADYVGSDIGRGWDPVCWSRVEAALLEAPKRPTIDFSGPSRETARMYAMQIRWAFTKTYYISEALRDVLGDVIDGSGAVDALRLNEALMASQRALALRAASKSTKERWQRQIGYLHHITQAVLTSAIDGLPAYADGERSPALKAAKEELADLKNRVDYLDQFNQNSGREIERLKAEVDRIREQRDERTTRWVEAEKARDTLLQVVGYALRQTDGFAPHQKILGFWDAVEPEFEHSFDESGGE